MQMPDKPADDEEQALEGISVSPPVPAPEDAAAPDTGASNDGSKALDEGQADVERRLEADPSDPDAKLDAGLDETFPTSDPPAATQPGSDQPVPSTGFDAEEEKRLANERGG